MLVEGSLNVKFMGSVQLGLPFFIGWIHAAVGLLEGELLTAEDDFEHFNDGSLTGVPVSPEPNEALLWVRTNQAYPHEGI